MITRPLDLASRLRSQPRSFDFFFFVNVGLLGLFFMLFGSRFVLAPGLGVDFDLPVLTGHGATVATTQRVISIRPSGQILADGLLNLPQLREWLNREAQKLRDGRKVKEPALLIRASASVPLSEVTEIVAAARAAGFSVVVAEDVTRPEEGR